MLKRMENIYASPLSRMVLFIEGQRWQDFHKAP